MIKGYDNSKQKKLNLKKEDNLLYFYDTINKFSCQHAIIMVVLSETMYLVEI